MTNTETIPTSLAAWLSVRSSAIAVAFYKSAFGAIETYKGITLRTKFLLRFQAKYFLYLLQYI
ncbi:MAG TPA: hypothetical protein VN958_19645 [Chitinophagaceae bacterium]|nr:hypothetical protein [Chitinophagaceae bacterium]